VVRAPVFAKDGTLGLKPGYFEAAKAWHQPALGFVLPPVPEAPTAEEIATACVTLLEPLQDFPFETDADRLHMLATIIEPFIRELINGPTPLHLIEKTDVGAGAGLLVDVASMISLGSWAALTPVPKSTEEWGKVLVTKLLHGEPMIVLDNLPLGQTLDSDDLAVALTGTYWQGRLLGGHDDPKLPIRTTWVATANNPSLSREMLRRSVRIRLTPQVDRPWLRQPEDFAIKDLRDWTEEHRSQLVHAVLTLVRAWLAAGRPMWAGIALGTFEKWSRVVGGILQVAGLEGFLGNITRLYEEAETDEDAVWAHLMGDWWHQFKGKPVAAGDLIEFDEKGYIADHGLVDRKIASSLGLRKGEEVKSLGSMLRGKRGRLFGTKRLQRVTKKTKRGVLWFLVDTTAGVPF
jgi:hypothetical protein